MNGDKAGKVLVLGSDIRSFLTVVRSLGRRNVTVDVAWCASDSPARFSRYIRRIHDLPSPSDENADWKRPFTDLLGAESYDLVIPCNDSSLIPLQENRDELEQYGRIYLLGERAYDIAFDKQKSTDLARSLGISVPRSRYVESLDQARAETVVLGLPLVAKPLSSFTLENLKQKQHVKTVREAGDFDWMLGPMLARGPVLLQKYFDGVGVGVEFLADRGHILVALQHRRLREPPGGGGSTYRATMPLDPELLAAAEKLVESLEYTGVGMVEFCYNFRTRQWIFVEINGRFWGSLPLAVASGADFPVYLYQMLVKDRHDFPERYRIGLRARNLVADVRAVVNGVRDEGLFTAKHLFALPSQLLGELFYVATFREVWDSFAFDDPRPGLYEMRQFAGDVARKLGGKLGRSMAKSPPLRTLQARRAKANLENARTVLFVCKGNICRSPFAQAYARHILPEDCRVVSCGYIPRENRCSPENAILAAHEFGIDLTEHRSRVLDEQLIEEADVIFTFDEENRDTILRRFPGVKGKLHRLAVLMPARELEIRDPYSGSLDDFRAVYASIARSIDRWGTDSAKETVSGPAGNDHGSPGTERREENLSGRSPSLWQARKDWLGRALWTTAIVYSLVLAYVLLTPDPLGFAEEGPKLEKKIDEVAADYVQHFVAYSLLSGLLAASSLITRQLTVMICLILALLHGSIAESLQSIVPGRYFTIPDLLANAGGVLLGGFLVVGLARFRKRTSFITQPKACS